MRIDLHPKDTRTIGIGVAAAAVAGVLLGAALKPTLAVADVGGPQQLLAGGGDRFQTAAYDQGTATYEGVLPDYVVGTDWVKARQAQVSPAHYAEPALMTREPEVAVYEAPGDLPTRVVPTTPQDELRTPTRYPSEAGNVTYPSDLPNAPPPPAGSDLG
ncbi:MAG: hypothetical protein DI570_13495 [Phenylobacterium zucineum]|nr:MAG: hypothetical protein DI570_13495 [Phenylobacterium zucineum]